MLPGGLEAEELADFSVTPGCLYQRAGSLKTNLQDSGAPTQAQTPTPPAVSVPWGHSVSLRLQSLLVYNLSISATRTAASERPRAGLETLLSGWRVCCSFRGLFPAYVVEWLTTTCNLSSRGPRALNWPPKALNSMFPAELSPDPKHCMDPSQFLARKQGQVHSKDLAAIASQL